MKEVFGYRVGAVQALQGFNPVLGGQLLPKKFLKYCVSKAGTGFISEFDLSMFSLDVVKSALKQLKTDYPKQRVRFGKFIQNNRVYLAIQPERPTPPDQWMIVAQEVQE